MIKLTLKEFSENIERYFNSNNSAYFAILDGTEVTYGNQDDCDLEYCQKHNIPVYNVKRRGGTVVYAKGSIVIAMIFDLKYGWISENFNTKLSEFIQKRIEPEHVVGVDGNDVLVDGFKVASSAESRVGENLEKIYAAFQISVNQDLEAIKHICKKEMIKTPKALSDYGITTEEIVNFCENYWDNFINNHN